MARAQREDVSWWFSACVDDYESAQLLFKGGKYSKAIHVYRPGEGFESRGPGREKASA